MVRLNCCNSNRRVLERNILLKQRLSTQMYKKVPANCWQICNGLASHPRGREIFYRLHKTTRGGGAALSEKFRWGGS